MLVFYIHYIRIYITLSGMLVLYIYKTLSGMLRFYIYIYYI